MSCLYSVLLDSRRGLNVMFFVFHEMLGVFLFLVLFMVLNYVASESEAHYVQ